MNIDKLIEANKEISDLKQNLFLADERINKLATENGELNAQVENLMLSKLSADTLAHKVSKLHNAKVDQVIRLTAESLLYRNAFYVSQSNWIEKVTGKARSITDKEILSGARLVVASVKADTIEQVNNQIQEALSHAEIDTFEIVQYLDEYANKLREGES